MEKIILSFILIMSPFILEAQIARTTIRNKKEVTIVTPLLSDSIKLMEDKQITDYCSEYILKYYPELSYPLFIIFKPDQIEVFPFGIIYNNYDGTAFNFSKEELYKIEKDGSMGDRLGVKIYSDRNIINLLKLIDCGIKNEKNLRKQFWKKRGKKQITIDDEKAILLEGEKLKKLLSDPPSKKIVSFMQKNQIGN